MCLAIYKPKGVNIAKRYLRNGFENNEDGAGFAIAARGKVEIFKGYLKFGDFWKAFKPYQGQQAIIHFRMATHGKINAENCHPFSLLDDQYAVIHNGIINIVCDTNKDRSDTWHFAELVLTPMLENNAMEHPALKYLIETSIGTMNRVVILGGDGSHVIYNEKLGQWHNGAWYSNDGFKRREYGFCGSIGDYWQKLGYGSKAYCQGPPRNGKYIIDPWDDYEDQIREPFPDYVPRDVRQADLMAADAEAEMEAELAAMQDQEKVQRGYAG